MKYKRKLVQIDKLIPGMIADQGVYDRIGHVLVAPESVLDEREISGLKRLGIQEMFIREEDYSQENLVISPIAQGKIESLTTRDPAKVVFSHEVRERVSEGIQYIYNNSESSEMDTAARNVTDDLMNVIDSNNAIVIDVNELKASDEYTFKHSVDVATISMVLAKQCGLSREEIREIGMSGLLHDVGKTRVPLEILNKPGRLTEDEFYIMKQHSVYGYRIVQEHGDYSKAICMGVLQHHEKMNGKGYPIGVTAEKIHPFAKLMGVADVYDALVTDRPYKKAFSQREAVEIVMSMSGELDMNAMKIFLESVILYPVGSIVALSNGEMAKVVKNNKHNALRPTVVGVESGTVFDLGEDINSASIVIN